jgi:hypothetical protein
VICWNDRVFPTAVRLFFATLLAGAGIVLVQPPAQAVCRCEQAGTRALAANADAVFTGTLRDRSRVRSGDRPATAYSVQAGVVYKGAVTTADVEVVSPANDCSLRGLRTNEEYVFFVTARGSELRADRCGGTARATGSLVRTVERELGEGTRVDPAPEAEGAQAVFTPVADAQPESLTRLAAPGAALVLIGLLGLLLVRRAGARDRAA